MSEIKIIEGNMTIRDARFCLLVARFNSFIVEQLQGGVIDTLLRHGAQKQNLSNRKNGRKTEANPKPE